ncbi:MAG: acetyl-CoA carboxylase carboxyltransferase subunit alpha [Chlamydiae bacterium]|nr:acetyl-CoA carboxylase carboxyltransferase subunit alpha [Chlamydiota bacterium]
MESLPHEKQIQEYEKTIAQLKESAHHLNKKDIDDLEKNLIKLKARIYENLTPWERVTISRHAGRPHSIDYIKNICEDFIEIFGDRTYADDHAIITGFAKIGGKKCLVIAQEKGANTEQRVWRNFGMPHPEGFRKALRIMKLAEKFGLPVVCFVDTPGAYPGLTAEERGQAWAIAENLRAMALLKTPIVVVIIGEAASGGALAIAVGDSIGMLENSYYSVITPEGCAAILWKEASKAKEAAEALKLTAVDAKELGIIDEILPEPRGGAHYNPAAVYTEVRNFIVGALDFLSKIPSNILLERRYAKFRCLGNFPVDTDPGI